MMKPQKHNNLGNLVRTTILSGLLALGAVNDADGQDIRAPYSDDYKKGVTEFVVESEKEISIPMIRSPDGPSSMYNKSYPENQHIDILTGYLLNYPDKKFTFAYVGDNFWPIGDTLKLEGYAHSDATIGFTGEELIKYFKDHGSYNYTSSDKTKYLVDAVATKRLE